MARFLFNKTIELLPRVWETQGDTWVSKISSALSAPIRALEWDGVSQFLGWFSFGVSVITLTSMVRGFILRRCPKLGPWLGDHPVVLGDDSVEAIAAAVVAKIEAQRRQAEEAQSEAARPRRRLATPGAAARRSSLPAGL